MTINQTPPDGQHPEFGIQRIYTKDISFETPSAPAIFKTNWQPQMNVNIQTNANHLEGDDYEVVLKLTITTNNQDKTAFLVEIEQAGIFTLKHFTQQQLGPVLSATCPNILFPYAREIIASLVMHGSFPQLNLAPINFDALYLDHLKQQQAEEQKTTDKDKTKKKKDEETEH